MSCIGLRRSTKHYMLLSFRHQISVGFCMPGVDCWNIGIGEDNRAQTFVLCYQSSHPSFRSCTLHILHRQSCSLFLSCFHYSVPKIYGSGTCCNADWWLEEKTIWYQGYIVKLSVAPGVELDMKITGMLDVSLSRINQEFWSHWKINNRKNPHIILGRWPPSTEGLSSAGSVSKGH